jgi:ABC-type branched-subunit amino acid transport system ATPase component
VLLVDHDMTLVLGICDRVHVLDLGRVIASGPPAAVRSDAAVVEAYLGRPPS